MKAITLLATFLIICISCNCQKKAAEQSNVVENKENGVENQGNIVVKQDQDGKLIADTQMDMRIEYEANTRGFYEKVIIQNQTISISKERDAKNKPLATKISDADWKDLTAFFNEVNLDQLPKLEAPTSKRLYDGAPAAELKVTYKNKDYTTTTFDHGFPPAGIKKLVDKLVSLTEKK